MALKNIPLMSAVFGLFLAIVFQANDMTAALDFDTVMGYVDMIFEYVMLIVPYLEMVVFYTSPVLEPIGGFMVGILDSFLELLPMNEMLFYGLAGGIALVFAIINILKPYKKE